MTNGDALTDSTCATGYTVSPARTDEDADPERGAGRTNGGKHLRWTRITKSVDIKDANAGLLKGSIGAPSSAAEASSAPGGPDARRRSSRSSLVSKTILRGVSGAARPGEVLALMGPSGSGKTSVLDVLSGRSAYGAGAITLDGTPVTDRVMKKLKKRVAYVKQSDLFFGHLTVRDQLTYTAFLRMPSALPRARKVAEVERIIRTLRLGSCADTQIYMISGGEKKRVNIGSELLTDPAIILLDEPTSGLDSTSAVALIKILHALARDEGKTIITSIHQPSSAVFFGFDKLMLLADGNVVYFGTPADSLEHVEKIGLECPAGYNAADHLMDLLVVDSAIDEHDYGDDGDGGGGQERRLEAGALPRHPAAAAGGTTTKQKLIESWDAEAAAKHIEGEDAEERARAGGPHGPPSESVVLTEKSFNSTWWTQYTVLVHRSMKNSRSAIFTTLNLIKAGAIGLMAGLLWFQMPYTEATVFDRSSYYFFTMTFWVFDAMFTAYMAFPLERAIIFKERGSGAYHLSAYFCAKTTSEAPARLALPAIYMAISYWMSGVNNNFSIFVGSVACSLLSVLAGESIGLFLGAAILDEQQGMVIMTIVALSLMVVGGFFVRNIPSWLMWLGYLSPFKYSYNSSVQLVFDRPVPCDGSGVLSVCRGATQVATEQEVLEFLGVEFSAGFNAGMLLLIFLIVRTMAFFALKSKKAEERM